MLSLWLLLLGSVCGLSPLPGTIDRLMMTTYDHGHSCSRSSQNSAHNPIVESHSLEWCQTVSAFVKYNHGRLVNESFWNAPRNVHYGCLCYPYCTGGGATKLGVEYWSGNDLNSMGRCEGSLVLSNSITGGGCHTSPDEVDYAYVIDCTIPSGGGAGDPHFCTLDGACYTFNGIGTYVFSKGQGFEVQVQTHAVNNHTAAISAIGVHVAGMPKLVVQWAGESTQRVKFLVNGELHDELTMPDGISASHSMKTTGGQYVLKWKAVPGLSLAVNYVHRSSFQLTVPSSFGQLSGIGGDNDGVASLAELDCSMESRLSTSSTMEEIYRVLEKCWKVKPSQSFFQADNQEIDYRPIFTPQFTSPKEEIAANKACEGNKFCLYDAAVTGDLDYARLTKLDMESFRV